MLISSSYWSFDEIMALQGEVFREQPGRRTLCFQHQGQSYFAKLHFGVGWREIVKNLLQFRLPILGAKNEWRALQSLQQLNIAAPLVVAYGERGWNPASKQSFIITQALTDTISLEELGKQWQQQPPSLTLKRYLIKQVAYIAKTLHSNGINHRDFYLCHFLVKKIELETIAQPQLHLIDLHRAQIRKHIPRRWLIKDLSGLWFSAMDCGLTRRDLLRFIKFYAADNNLPSFNDKRFWRQVEEKAVKLYHKTFKHSPMLP